MKCRARASAASRRGNSLDRVPESDVIRTLRAPGSACGLQLPRIWAGVGADYYVRSDFLVNVEFSAVLPTSNVGDVRFLPLVFGAQYRF